MHELAAHGRDAIVITTADIDKSDPTILYCNSAFEAMTGYSSEEAIGQSPRTLLQADETDISERLKIRDAMKAWLDGDEDVFVRATLKNKRKTGEIFWVEIILVPMWSDDYKTRYWGAIEREITDQVLQQQQIETLATRLSAIQEAAPDGILMVDKNLLITDFNPAAEDLFGWPSQDIIGKSLSILIPEDIHSGHEGWARNFMDDSTGYPGMRTDRPAQARHKDGYNIDVSISLADVTLKGERYAIALVRDVSELRAKNRRLKELADDLMVRTKQAEASLQSKSTFLATMSHEIRTPLNAVIGFSQVIENLGDDTNYYDKSQEYLGYISSSGKHLHAMLEDILNASAIEQNDYPLNLDHFGLKDLLQSVYHMHSNSAAKKGLDFRLIDPVDTELCSDEKRLMQVLINVVSNAIKYTQTGCITIVAANTGSVIEIKVSDTGNGIPLSEQEAIFEKFGRMTSDVYTANTEGVGLGLFLARTLAQKLGGDITLESEVGKGSTFTVSVAKCMEQRETIQETLMDNFIV